MSKVFIFLAAVACSFTGSIVSQPGSHSVCTNVETYTYELKDTNQVYIISNYNHINSVAELVALYKNNPVFIDLWATWCGPCAEEFKYSKGLYQSLSKKGIEIIYVSFDKDQDDTVWRQQVNLHRLSGQHIRANKALRDDLTTLIWGGIDAYSLPNYLLFDRSGQLVNKTSLHPSAGAALLKQIDTDLKKN